MRATPAASPDAGVASPCTQICTLDADDICLGCGRTLDEIAAWGGMTADEKRSVRAASRARKIRPSGIGG